MEKQFIKKFVTYAILSGILSALLLDKGISEVIFAAIFFGATMAAIDLYSERKWGPKLAAEAARMKSLKDIQKDKDDKTAST